MNLFITIGMLVLHKDFPRDFNFAMLVCPPEAFPARAGTYISDDYCLLFPANSSTQLEFEFSNGSKLVYNPLNQQLLQQQTESGFLFKKSDLIPILPNIIATFDGEHIKITELNHNTGITTDLFSYKPNEVKNEQPN